VTHGDHRAIVEDDRGQTTVIDSVTDTVVATLPFGGVATTVRP
jgi:hypothetical protein